MSEFDSGAGRKGILRDVMRRISTNEQEPGATPEGDSEPGPRTWSSRSARAQRVRACAESRSSDSVRNSSAA